MESADPQQVVELVRRRAGRTHDSAMRRLSDLGIAPSRAVDAVAQRARVTVNFHPDRYDRWGRTVIDGLLQDGRYRTQFETGLSSGQRSAVEGGHRLRFERDHFGVELVRRPVYGALDARRDPHGGSPRFGSSFIVLSSRCLPATTFSGTDSHLQTDDVGTIDALAPVVAAMFERSGDPVQLLADIERDRNAPTRQLDDYVEAQVHGDIRLDRDVTELHLDPSFSGTGIERSATTLADRFDIDLAWHGGSELAVESVPNDFRGPTMPNLAAAVARPDSIVDAAAIGRSLAKEPYTPPRPDGDPEHGPFQQHKKLWHCVLRFGSDATSFAD